MVDDRPTSLWLDRYPGSLTPRPALGGDLRTDVVIVGGGFTGLWTAYYLNRLDPTIRICIVEREICGFGASGRNGGWAIGELAAGLETYAAHGSLDGALRQLRAVADAVDEIGRVAATEGVDCGFAKGGTVRLARNAAQECRLRDHVAHQHALGVRQDELRLLDADEARTRVGATDVRLGAFLTATAALDPARLARGLADVVEARGVTIHEQTAVTDLRDRTVSTPHGTVTADVVIRATEGYTRDLPGLRRTLLPVYSLMVATEPLDVAVFDEIGLAGRPTFSDERYMVIYGQRTDDDRIAFGGRGSPYSFGSRVDPERERDPGSHRRIIDTLCELFPVLNGVGITHRWGGVLGVPRNWTPSVHYDRSTGHGTAGGYVGEGVAASNLAGRTLGDLIVGADTDRTHLPWVGLGSRRWEPEPLRWLGVRGAATLLARADRTERRTGRTSRIGARLAGALGR